MAEDFIQPREAERIWKKLDDLNNELHQEISDLRKELSKKEEALEKLRTTNDASVADLTNKLTAITTALAVSKALSGYKKYLFGLLVGLMMTGLGAWLGRVKW